MALKRYKRILVVLLLLFLVYLILSVVNYKARVTDIARLSQPLPTSSEERSSPAEVDFKVVMDSKDTLNAVNVGLMLKGINRTLSELMKHFHALTNSENSEATTTKATTTKATTRPSIDIVNDYYPFVDFKIVFPEISPNVERKQDLFMIVLVNSGAKGDEYRKRREAIRQTWGNQSNCEQRKALREERLKNLRWLLVFVVGKAGPGTNDDELNMAEARQHNDMLIGNITDNYINNVIKLFMGQIWASRFDIKYTLKADDDVYLRIPRVLEYFVNAKFPRPFYGGMTYMPIRVNRVIGGKWTVSWKYYGEVNFPMFNAGAFFILSTDLLDRLFNYVHIRKPFHTDDAYVGVAMRDFGVKITTIFSFGLRPDMNEFIRKAKDCEILRFDGFSHNMDPESTRFLHDRLKTLACGSVQTKC